MDKVLPNNLNYSQIKPIGYPSQIKIEKFTPVSFTNASMSDVIRFNINTNGFWDPYSAYIKIEVDTGDMDPVGVQALDQSAQSFINQLIISNQGAELERIEEYDVLASILMDMSYSPENRSSRAHEGVQGICGITNYRQYTNPTQFVQNPLGTETTIGVIGFMPNFKQDTMMLNQANANSTITAQAGNIYGNMADNIGATQRFENLLCRYSRDSVDVVQSGNYLSQDTQLTQVSYEAPKNLTDRPRVNGTTGQDTQGGAGFLTAYNYSLSSGSNDYILSPNYLHNTCVKGQLNQYATKQKQTFCIPLLSGLLGILMPQASYKYLPMKALQNLILEFRLNPYALYTSGYQDVDRGTAMTSYNQVRRYWKITKFELNVEMQYFESNLENIILSQLNSDKGIILHSNSWQLGPRYSIPANTSPNGAYQVNLGFESLRNVIWCFLPDDYLTYNFCRKQYRLSHNISQYYLKIGTDYYPNLPITGHAGNPNAYGTLATTGTSGQRLPQIVDSDLNNSEFLIQLYKVFGRYNDISIDTFIDPVNFAVNNRAYDPTQTGPLLSSNEFQNLHTAGGNPLFHEQRCVGRAVYALNLETLNNDFSVISGLNTINNRPFEINIKSDTTNTSSFSRPSTMFVFCQYDMLIQLKANGVQVLGRG